MTQTEDSNAELWKSEEVVKRWQTQASQRERDQAEQRRFMAYLLPFQEGDAFTFLDLGAGTGAASRVLLSVYPQARSIMADFSQAMMAEGKPHMEPYEGRYQYVEFDMASGDWPAAVPSQLDAVISSLCIHHLRDERKRTIFAEIRQHLKPGAWYVNYDPIRNPDKEVEAAWQRVGDRYDPTAAQRRANRSPAELVQWQNHMRHIITLEPQIQLLRDAGFAAVDTYWKKLDYVVYGGHNP